VKGVFVELPAFERHRTSYLDDEAFRSLQSSYWWQAGMQFWLFTIYDKDEMADLTPPQRQVLKRMIKAELEARRMS
jgi:hypothetical protein